MKSRVETPFQRLPVVFGQSPGYTYMSYDLRWEPHGVIKHFYGKVTDQDMMQSVIETESDPRFDSLHYVINDFLECTAYAVSGNTVDQIAVIDRGASYTNSHIRIAVVSSAPEIISLATRYARSPVSAYETRVFPTLEEARAWLDDAS